MQRRNSNTLPRPAGDKAAERDKSEGVGVFWLGCLGHLPSKVPLLESDAHLLRFNKCQAVKLSVGDIPSFGSQDPSLLHISP